MKKLLLFLFGLVFAIQGMAQYRAINTGTTANDRTGETLRSMGLKTNTNFLWQNGGNADITKGDLLIGDTTNIWERLLVGTEGQALIVTSGKPAWSTITTSSVWGAITGTIGDQSDLVTLFAGKVSTSVTVNGHPLSGNVTVTASDLSLGNVNNTSDANKPVSTATQTALSLKENSITATTSADYYRGDKTFQTLNKTAVGLPNVDNTSDANKPVSTAQATADALNLKIASNLSDLNNVVTARSSLGLGTLATQNGTFSGTSLGTNTGDQTSVTGNAGTATALANPRTIGTITGDATSAGSSFDGSGNNANALTLATVNSNTGSFGSATQSLTVTYNAKGLATAVSAQTVTPALTSITGFGTGVATFLATPTSANAAAALTDETGTGSVVFSDNPSLTNLALPSNTTATTQSALTSGTTVSTTAYTDASNRILDNTQSGDYTLVLSDELNNINMSKATAKTLTVPTNASVAFPIGSVRWLTNTSSAVAGILTVAGADGTVTVTGTSGALTDAGYNVPMRLRKIGTNAWLLENGSPGTWYDWATTFAGFSAVPSTYVFRYTVVGKTCHYWFTIGADGTSNATTFTMTFPYAAKSGVGQSQFNLLPTIVNNSAATTTPGRITLTTGSNVMSLAKDASGAVWTGSGGKRAFGSGQYEID